jgi:hypothetical protein
MSLCPLETIILDGGDTPPTNIINGSMPFQLTNKNIISLNLGSCTKTKTNIKCIKYTSTHIYTVSPNRDQVCILSMILSQSSIRKSTFWHILQQKQNTIIRSKSPEMSTSRTFNTGLVISSYSILSGNLVKTIFINSQTCR